MCFISWQVCFLNYSTGKFFMSDDKDFDDDEGYLRVLSEDVTTNGP